MIALFLLQWWPLSHSTRGLFRLPCTVLILSPKPVSFSLIGMFYSLTDICAGASICQTNTLFPLDLLVNSLDPLLLHGMLVGGGQH